MFLLPSMLSRNLASFLYHVFISLKSWWFKCPNSPNIKHFLFTNQHNTILNASEIQWGSQKYINVEVKMHNLIKIGNWSFSHHDRIYQLKDFFNWCRASLPASWHHALPTITHFTMQSTIYLQRNNWSVIGQYPSLHFFIESSPNHQ